MDSVSFRPQLADCLKNYTRGDFLHDLVAGVTVGVVALPLAMAFGIASGVTPAAGLVTAIVAGFLISALGGSRVQIGGPTGAFVAIVFGIISEHGLENLFLCTLMAGALLVVMGLARMGTMIKYIPYPVTVGFTSGIAILILASQVRDFFGLQVQSLPAHFVEKVKVLVTSAETADGPTITLAVASLAVILLWPKRWAKRIPGTIVALGVGTLGVGVFGIPVETIGSRYGGIPQGLPPLHIPDLAWERLEPLFSPALTIALLAAIESLLSAVVADGMTDGRHNSNQELVAQGIANLVTPLFGGIPATGAIARTATNVRSGARTPVAGIIHALVLLVMVMVLAPWAKFIPLATLSAVLVVVAVKMGEWHHFRRLAKWPKSDSLVFLSAFGLTVLVDLTVAVEVGMVLAALLFTKRISETTQISLVDHQTETEGSHHSLVDKVIPPGVIVYRIFGAFFFGAADKLETALKRANQEPEVLILRMRKVLALDATGLNALEDLFEKLQGRGKHLVLSAPHTQPLLTMERAGFVARLGRENICPHIDAALDRAREILTASGKLRAEPAVPAQEPAELKRLDC